MAFDSNDTYKRLSYIYTLFAHDLHKHIAFLSTY